MSIEALKQALEFVEYHSKYWNGAGAHPQEIGISIRQAIAEAEKPEPVAYQDTAEKSCLETVPAKGTLLHTSPPKREPLTDEQKLRLCKQFPDHLTFNAIHAIEAALGIGEKK